jgi:alpha,alpha-trehalase
LKLLDYHGNGAIVAAATSSLPETIGGVRNWDYRYAWIRDAAFSVYALRRIGFREEAWYFLRWVLDVIERGERPDVMYDLDGTPPAEESEDQELEGYRGSRPVRWGNGAAGQDQHDMYGEILDCAYQWVAGGQSVEPELWEKLRALVETAKRKWRQPDRGIWEIRATNQLFTYSIALCQVALDRGARLAERLKLSGQTDLWKREATKIREAILEEAWNPELRALTASLGGNFLDASVLALPLRRVIDSAHPRMVATTDAIRSRLDAGSGLLYRYDPEEFEDGLGGKEGAFLLCSFWLVDNLANQGKLDEAEELFDSLCGRANELGLLPEQIDPGTGDFLGNYPQAFSHVGLISSGFNLARRAAAQRGKPEDGRILADSPE